ncbi:MAG: hypothetical protein WAL83_13520 [Arenicellales bacterium]
MFIGHFAVGLGAKRAAPAVSLGTLFLAAQFADLLWPTFVLLGIEKFAISPGATAVTPLDFVSYPYSHSLVMLVLWAVLVAGVYYYARHRRMGAALVIAAVVLSHWVLDVVAHRPDMPVTINGSLRLGLGLWNSPAATFIVENAMLVVGIYLYLKTTQARDRIGQYAFWGLIVFLVVVNLANMFGPPPPSVAAVAWSAEGIWLMVAWGYWIDRHREAAV